MSAIRTAAGKPVIGMSLLKKFTRLLSAPARVDDWSYWITVRCNRCGETIRARVDLRNDLSPEFGNSESATSYFCRKVLLGEQRCFQQIEVELTFDARHKVTDRQIRGGQFVDD